jgi:hypothetical protein
MNGHTVGNRPHGRAAGWIVLLIVLVCLFPRSTAAQDILITDGSVEWIGYTSLSMGLRGDHAFSAGGLSETSSPLLGNCYREGALVRVSGGGGFGDWALSVTVTLDGVVQTFSAGSPTIPGASLLARFDGGSFVVPRVVQPTTMMVPAVFSGTFRANTTPLILRLAGTGVATVTLWPQQLYDGVTIYCIPLSFSSSSPLRFDAGAALPTPWLSADVGSVVGPGGASYLENQFVVVGDGGDIWGPADAFRFAYHPLAGSGSVTAHVAAATPITTVETLSEFAKAGVMLRASTAPASASVILDVKPNGELEFMTRYANGEATQYLGGATVAPQDVWLRLSRGPGNQIAAAYSPDGVTWTDVGIVVVPFSSDEILAGLAVTSHQPDALYAALFDHVSVTGAVGPNLLVNGDFEAYAPPALGPPGWISDHAFRQAPAKSETHQPRSGAKNGACWTTEYLDCGMYQEVVAPVTGTYTYTVYATADRAGGLVGANVNSQLAASRDVTVAPFGDYSRHTMTFTASAGDVIRVWMYSPAWPGYVVVDDASLTLVPSDGSQ